MTYAATEILETVRNKARDCRSNYARHAFDHHLQDAEKLEAAANMLDRLLVMCVNGEIKCDHGE